MMRRLCGDTAACVNMRRPFFILRSTDAGVFAPHAPLHHADLPVVRAFSASFPACIRRSHRVSLSLSPFPHPGVRELPLPGCFPSCRRHSRNASRMTSLPPRIKPRRLRRVRTQQLRRNTEHPRGQTLNNFSPLCSSGALRASSDKNALVGSTGRQNVFSRLHRPVRGIPSSEKTRTLRGYAAFSPPKEPSPVWAAARTWMCPHALTRPLLVRSTFLLRAPAAFPLSLTISIRPRSNGHAPPSSASQLSRPRLSCPPSLPRSFSPASLLPSCVLPERDRRAAQTTPLRAFFSRLRSARFLLPAPCSLISQAKTPVPRQCLFFPRARLPVFALRPHSAPPFACSASSLHPRRSSGHTDMLSSRSSPYAKGPPA